MSTGGVIAIALVGIVLGWYTAVLVLRRNDIEYETAVDQRDPLTEAVLTGTPNGYAVLDAEHHVLLANERAVELGIVRAGFADHRIIDAADRAFVSGEPVDVDLSERHARTGPTTVHAEVRRIDPGLVLVIGADESAAARVEAVRRDFVANVSHELKTPIGAISLLAEALQDGADDPEVVRYFTGKIQGESERLGTLVSELIALSKLQGAAESIEHTMVSIDGVLEDVLRRSGTISDAAGITVGVGGSSGLFVKGDRTLLVTALANLVENAIHYSPHGTPVTINRTVRGSTVELAVTDRGTGIPAEHQERVFERFFRSDPARSRQTGGTGLGLAIVKHVAANHAGDVTLWSRVGTGSTFTLRIPLAAGGDVRPASTSGSPSAATTGNVELNSPSADLVERA